MKTNTHTNYDALAPSFREEPLGELLGVALEEGFVILGDDFPLALDSRDDTVFLVFFACSSIAFSLRDCWMQFLHTPKRSVNCSNHKGKYWTKL